MKYLVLLTLLISGCDQKPCKKSHVEYRYQYPMHINGDEKVVICDDKK